MMMMILTKTVITCKIKHLQNVLVFYFTRNHHCLLYLQAVCNPAKMFCNIFANVLA